MDLKLSDQNLNHINTHFELKKKLVNLKDFTLFDTLPEEEKICIKFLIAFLPLSDLGNLSLDFIYQHVKLQIEIFKLYQWDISHEIWLHYVLPFRVSNEEFFYPNPYLVFFMDLKDIVKNCTMEQAVLKINYWCHSQATFQPTDTRTISALGVLKSTFGRCGEETVFLITALRSVGIPARQVYVPRWSHCDSNHAWVEVFVGSWKFLGACEPEPILNKGWFNESASRAMVIHASVFGKLLPQENKLEQYEQIMEENNNYSYINVTGRYAQTHKICIVVKDQKGNLVDQAIVKIKLFNMAEFFTICSQTTNEEGKCYFNIGKGSFMIWVQKDQNFGQQLADSQNLFDSNVDIIQIELNNYVLKQDEFLVSPPRANKMVELQNISENQMEVHSKNLQKGDEIRQAKKNNYIQEQQFLELAEKNGINKDIWQSIKKSYGNWQEILQFSKLPHQYQEIGMMLLETLTVKDFRDVRAQTLIDHTINSHRFLQQKESLQKLYKENPKFYAQYVLNSRVRNELLEPYRKILIDEFQSMNPLAIIKWIKNKIQLDTKNNFYRRDMNPLCVYNLKKCDEIGRRIFFVALCRTFGIPARLEPGYQTPQYYCFQKSIWIDVQFEDAEERKKYTLELIDIQKKLKYGETFTLSKYQQNEYQLLVYDQQELNFQVDEGKYLLTTGKRNDKGDVMVKLDFFEISGNLQKKVEFELLEQINNNLLNLTLEHINLDNLVIQDLSNNQKIDFNSLFNDSTQFIVLGLVDPQQEPTIHLLNDFIKLQKELDNLKNLSKIILCKQSDQSFEKDLLENIFKKVIFAQSEESIVDLINIGQDLRQKLPTLFLINQQGNVMLEKYGYSIGLGNLVYEKLQLL